MSGLMQTNLKSLPLVYRGKVRECYAVGQDKLLMIASDRISAFDSILSVPIPNKGKVLTQITQFWFDKLTQGMVVKRLTPILIECVARGYIIGGGWKDYQATGSVCGIKLPEGLKMAQKLPEPIFTPAAKAEIGTHDENISFEKVVEMYGSDVAQKIRDYTLDLYTRAAEYAATRGIIIADTKFEFGLDENGNVCIMDEMLTPDSSRFWPADQYTLGISPPSYDKQFLRDWLESTGWNKVPPAPVPPEDIIEKTSMKYREALVKLTGEDVQ